MANSTKYLLAIIALFIFSYPAVAAEPDIYLTNQDGVKTTQFGRGDSIYLEGSCPVAPSSLDGIRIYIAFDKGWADGDKLSDVSAAIESMKVSSDMIPKTLIWRSPLNDGAYDVVIDVNNDYVLQGYENCIIGKTGAGFRVGSAPPPPPAPAPVVPPPPPAPAPAPAPTPAPSLEPPQEFSLQDSVEVKNLANVRKSPGGSQIGQQGKAAEGSIAGGPVKAAIGGGSYWFWNVDFEDDPDGWVADQTLTEASTKPAEEPKKEPAPEITSEPEPTPAEKTAEASTQETTKEELAQASNVNSGMGQLVNAIVIGLAILLGLVIGSSIIARAIRRE